DEMLRCVAIWHDIYHIRGCEGARREPDRRREPRLQVHHVQLQLGALRCCCPSCSLLSSVLRRGPQVRLQKKDIRQEIGGSSSHPFEVGPHGSTDRGNLCMGMQLYVDVTSNSLNSAGKYHLPVQDNASRASKNSFGWSCRSCQGTGNTDIRVLCQRSCSNLW